MPFAYMGKLLRVNLTTGKVSEEKVRADWTEKYVGGPGLATRYLYQEVPKGADPLGPENLLIFMTGPLTGTAAASAGRYSVVAKSPLTGIWGHGNSGGNFGPALKRSGYDGILFEGIAPNPVYLKIIDGKAELLDARPLWGKSVSETESALKGSLGKHMHIACIGPAGENLVRYASIMNNSHRSVGRSGLGAVMGAKKLKALVCSGKAAIHLAEKERFNSIARRQITLLNESMLKVGFETFGTNMVSDMVNARGGYPTLNWQKGVFDRIEEVNGQALTDKVLVKEVRCFACPIACGRGTQIKEGPWKGHQGEGPEYETTNMFGAACGVSDLNAITMANYLCNDYGLDTISTGSTIAFSMECFQKGLLTDEQTGGMEIEFGNPGLVVDLIGKIARREGIGNLLAEGTKVLSGIIGQGSERFAMQVKGLELPAYDPRAAKITGLGYVTANRGGDHITAFVQGPTFIDAPFLIVDDSRIEDPFLANPEEVRVVVDLENALTMFDCMGACKFMGILLLAEDFVELINAATGWNYTVTDFRRCGERNFNLMRLFCVREGITRESDTLPKRLMEEPLPDGPAAGEVISQETLERLKDAYYALRGWDGTTGIPTPEKMQELGLDGLIKDVW
ncbi:MAG: aldehyde ferredoxin oxidoreductase family protein [Deltaproteobacteria bacterium]|nr:aldehyde ferredoxin oxidoreductase family protein [Deltaproteobacteria bacterium]